MILFIAHRGKKRCFVRGRRKLKITAQKKSQHEARLKRLQGALKKEKLDSCLIEQPLELFYFSGLKLSAGRLLVHSTDVLLLVDGRYLQMAQEKFAYKTALDHPEP